MESSLLARSSTAYSSPAKSMPSIDLTSSDNDVDRQLVPGTMAHNEEATRSRLPLLISGSNARRSSTLRFAGLDVVNGKEDRTEDRIPSESSIELDDPEVRPSKKQKVASGTLNSNDKPINERLVPTADSDLHATPLAGPEGASEQSSSVSELKSTEYLDLDGLEQTEESSPLRPQAARPSEIPTLTNKKIDPEETPIIILSEDEDSGTGDPVKLDAANQESNEIARSPYFQINRNGSGSSPMAVHRASHENLMADLNRQEQQLIAAKTTQRNTKVILQKKLHRRDASVKDAEAKYRLLSEKVAESPSSSDARQYLDEMGRQLVDLKKRRENVFLKLRDVERKERDISEQYLRFSHQKELKAAHSSANLQNATRDHRNTAMLQARSRLIQRKQHLERLLDQGKISSDLFNSSVREIENSIRHLDIPNSANSNDESKSAIFFKSIDVARNLIAKNSVRSPSNKNLMYYLLDILADFMKNTNQGKNYSMSQKRNAERAVTDLERHGVKMPALSKFLEGLGFVVKPDIFDRMRSYENRGRAIDDDFKSVDPSSQNSKLVDEEILSHHIKEDRYQYNSLQLSNIYNSQDNESLQELLESLKEVETEVDGEELTPPELTVNLMKHQRQGLSWLLAAEKSNKKGGLLADDMGLGKTVQAISLMIANKSPSSSCKTNLIVAPVAVLRVWDAELRAKIKREARLRVMIFGGAGGAKVTSYRDLLKHDVVLVSYQTLASELKKHWPQKLKLDNDDVKLSDVPNISAMNALKERGREYWSPFFCNESQFYRIILDEAQNIKNKKTKAATACCTLDATYRWALSGTPIQNNIMEFYSIIRYLRIPPYNREHKFKADIGNPLGKISTNYDSYDRKQAIKKIQVLLRAIMLRRTKDSKIDGEPILQLPSKAIDLQEDVLSGEELQFYSKLENTNQKKVEQLMTNKGRGNYSNILSLLLRLRQACCHPALVTIGEHKNDDTKVVNGKSFEHDWMRLYSVTQGLTEAARETIMDGLDSMMCPYCMEQMEPESTSILTPCGHLICESCVEPFMDDARFETEGWKPNDELVVPCLVCKADVSEKAVITYRLYDQIVNKNYTEKDLRAEFEDEREAQKLKLKNGYHINLSTLQPSLKVGQCLKIVGDVLSTTKDEKVIIFSQFVTFFDLLQHFLAKELRVPLLRYDGSLNSKVRAQVIEEFYQCPTKRVLLISMKAGNAGLTLTCANHVVLVDPFWNPFVEEQAMDRCYRISQQKNVKVYRLLVKNSVEDRILELQKKKRDLVDSAMDPSKIREVNRLGRQELGFLFGLNSLNGPGR
ncbi:LAMI_0C00738g1_1 [Lachancea mirantina]|uniref:LAMI_0C00738g1_1 n=1 Tax=Lachancea mirantina TaxID=1230905 RepID=A0A1G4IZN8_9SACH|nr:LAMI_0C00738g1_1 [Lachancea mirantina]